METARKEHLMAISALIIACTLWGTTFFFGKGAFAELAVSHVVLLRFAVASAVLLPIAFFRRVRIRVGDLPLFLLTGFLTVPVTFMLQFGGLALTSAARASLIIGALPPILALAAAVFHGERLSVRGWSAVATSSVGILLIVGLPAPGSTWLGDGMVLLSLVTTAAWVLLSKRLTRQYDGLFATAIILGFGTLTLLPISLLRDGLPPTSVSSNVWGSVVIMGVFCTASTFTLWNWALERVPAARAGVFVNLEPVVGAALGFVIFHDTVSPLAFVGGALVLGAAWTIALPDRGDSSTTGAGITPLRLTGRWFGRRMIAWGRWLQHFDAPLSEIVDAPAADM